MCQFCIQHGEGEKWYLRAKNYSEDWLSDIRRRAYIEEFVTDMEGFRNTLKRMEALDARSAWVRRITAKYVTRRTQRDHFGQVVPIEEVDKILDTVTSVVRIACLCRHVNGQTEARYCYGLSLSPDGGKFAEIVRQTESSFLGGPDALDLETLSRDKALEAMRNHEREGLCHTVWTFVTPFIGAICNCDRTDCLAMKISLTHELPIMFRAETVALTDKDKCEGCRECLKGCPFGAIGWSAADCKASVDARHCYGCGVCRSWCEKGAIRLEARTSVPEAAHRWL